ncbi:effector-associated domain 2-containing protein [Streptomyces sp. bgisy091]|uniref:effector-associated domain 2-containing protein n=1 Tax=Streptomyces sp. bgisy091 TaxID=3413778 RepID=UPI003D7217B4
MNRPTVQPHQVFALVVGIERYAAGRDWDLPGPARDALRFCDWLRARGVPESNIQLHLSPLPGTAPGVPFRAADHDCLRRAFVEDIPRRDDQALWVWWGGHGVLDVDENLALYAADATLTDRRAIDVESALTRLRSDATPCHTTQMWLIDACRTFDEHHHFPQSLPVERLPTGARHLAHRQTLMFAAGRGQRAGNDPLRRLGLFSDIVLGELSDDPLPDPLPLFEAVKAKLAVLRAEGRTEQIPSLRLETPGHSERLPAGPRPDAGPGERVAVTPMAALVTALLAYPLMKDRDERQALINELPPAAVARMPRHTTPRVDVIGIVRSLSAVRDSLWKLYDAVTLLDDDPDRARELRRRIEDVAEDPSP